MSYSRDLAFDAALDAQRRDEARDYSEEDFVDLDTPDCECPANEPLCEAIMEKARSYSVDDIYPARAYKRAAEKVATLTVSVFSLTDAQQRRLGVGPKTNKFIHDWLVATRVDAPCYCEENQELYDILLDKADSYDPEKESYQSDAYKRAAQYIASLKCSVFTLSNDEQRRLGVGPKTNQFIYIWIVIASRIRGNAQ